LFAGIDAEQRLLLFLGRFFIDMDNDAPISFEHVSRDVTRKPHREARHVDTVDGSFVEMMRQRAVASTVIGVDANPAGTEDFTITDFEEAAFEFVGHSGSPFETALTGYLGWLIQAPLERSTPPVIKAAFNVKCHSGRYGCHFDRMGEIFPTLRHSTSCF
jgi:hypothetical protein